MDETIGQKATRAYFRMTAAGAFENTATRLGVDPVALAEACRDGEFLQIAIDNMQISRDMIAAIRSDYPRHARTQRVCSEAIGRTDTWLDKLAALKRQEGES